MCCGNLIIQMPNICFLNFSTKEPCDFHKIFFFNLSRNYSFVQIMILHCLFFHNCLQEQQRMYPHSNPRHQRNLFLTDFDAQGLSASLDAYFDQNRRNFENWFFLRKSSKIFAFFRFYGVTSYLIQNSTF